MHFEHVRIYNNIVRNTGREAIQIANMVSDVEIYNNTLLNAGTLNEPFQNNILQIGDNSVCKVYNNIMSGAPGLGIITFGMGANEFINNYINLCQGVFIDNRLFTSENDPVIIRSNFFVGLTGTQTIENQNELNPILVDNNQYNKRITFYQDNSGNLENSAVQDNTRVKLSGIAFKDPTNDNYELKRRSVNNYGNIGAPGGVVLNETPEAPLNPVQLVLTSDMIVDEVVGGSNVSANYLVDEQSFTPINDLHPVSDSWKPHWNMDNAPYHIYIDLQREYLLTSISVHDMNGVSDLEISIGSPGAWELLCIEPCDGYKTWKVHNTNVSTRYVRLTMRESVYASINELVLFGVEI